MKKILVIFFFISQFSIFNSAFSQIVVPKGWENIDSLRFGLFGTGKLSAVQDTIIDSLGCNFEEDFGLVPYDARLFGHRKGYMGYVSGVDFMDIAHIGVNMKQRIYYPSPNPISIFDDPGYYWRYNDISFNSAVRFHNNTYDTNDISLYMEYPRNDSIGAMTFSTRRFKASIDSAVRVRDEGRVILGYSDNRFADKLLRTSNAYWHLHKTGLVDTLTDTAKTFSATLEFNIDTSSINTSGSTIVKDSLPLLRFQILYKQGEKDSLGSVIDTAWSVLPFVPFKDSTHKGNVGWYKVIDTTITKAIYNSLPDDWRKEDVAENGTLAHPSWHFKQLHIMLKDMPQSMKNLIKMSNNMRVDYGKGSGASGFTYSSWLLRNHSDSIVACGVNLSSSDTLTLFKNQYLLETRALSTYRATVRIRSMCWQDTVVDKILYRKLFSGDTVSHSCNPDGSRGGWDSLVTLGVKQIYDSCHAYGTQMREYLTNDEPPFNSLSLSAIAYTDYFLSQHGMAAHIREQDQDGGETEQYMRERLGYDGNPPSMYENQYNMFSQSIVPVFPSDYVVNGVSLVDTIQWPHNAKDSMVGLLIGRQDLSGGGHDTLEAYKQYTDQCNGINWFAGILRNSARNSLYHPKNKRYAIESDIQGWGTLAYDRGPFGYNQRQTTPEETTALIYAAIANGIGSISVAQPFENITNVGTPGLFGFGISKTYTHSYNFGRRHSTNTTNYPSAGGNELDSGISPYYLGYANSYRAYLRAIGRINQIYDTTHGRNEIPFRRFTWQNAYSTHKTYSAGDDSSTKINSVFKCFCTTSVKRWSRDSSGKYIDSLLGSGGFVADSGQRTYAEIGLFKDSINTTTKHYAALVVNTRLWPSLRDAADSIYYNQGLDSAKDRSQSTLGDIDTRRIWLKIDTNMMDASERAPAYYVHDLWKPDSLWLVSNDTISIYVKPGEAKFLYIVPAANLTLGRLTDNLYNNGRHIAAVDTGSSGRYGIGRYICTYARNGRICISYPAETPAGPNQRTTGTPVDSVIVIDTTGHSYNPSIAFNHRNNTICVTWRRVLVHDTDVHKPGSGSDTTLICYARASLTNQYHFSAVKVFDSILTPWGSVIPPAAAPRDTSYIDSLKHGEFWIGFQHPHAGGILLLIDTNSNILRKQNFWTPDSLMVYEKFVSLATHLPYDSVYIAFEEGIGDTGQIYYTRGYLDPYNNGNLIVSPNPALDISTAMLSCGSHCPQIADYLPALTGGHYTKVVWETITPTPTPALPNLYTHYAVQRFKTRFNAWSDFTVFPVYRFVKDTITPPYEKRIYVNSTHCDLNPDSVRNDQAYSSWMNWRDYDRLMWNNTDGSIELARYGAVAITPALGGTNEWDRYTFPEWAQDPAMPTLSYVANSIIPHVFMYRSGAQHEDGLYDARITNQNFPVNPVSNGQVNNTIKAFPATAGLCSNLYVKAKIGNVRITTITSDTSRNVRMHEVSPLDTLADQPTQWGDKKGVFSYPFTVNTGDTLSYMRDFHLDFRHAGDTAAIAAYLTGPSDYIAVRVYLRRKYNDAIVAVLDTEKLTTSSFAQSSSSADSSKKRYTITATDSLYITMEITRGDTTNPFIFCRIESHDDFYNFESAYPDSSAYKKSSPNQWQPVQSPEPIDVSVHPNPSQSSMQISVNIPKNLLFSVTITDILGRPVKTLFNNVASGEHYDFTIGKGEISEGIYILRIQSGNSVISRKIEFLR